MQSKTISYKQRNKFLAVACVLVIIIIIAGPVRNTITLWRENGDLHAQLAMAEKAPHELPMYRKQAADLKKLIHFTTGEADVKQEILNHVANANTLHNTILLSLEEPRIFSENNFLIETYQVVMKGSYVGLVKSVSEIDGHLQSAKVVGVQFVLEQKQNSKYLAAHIFIQTSKGN